MAARRYKIRNKNLGVSFRRHHVIGSYTADFYCAECALIIELQDNIRFTPTAQAQQDQRDTFLQNLGLTLLRFSNEQILKNIDATLEKINRAIANNKTY